MYQLRWRHTVLRDKLAGLGVLSRADFARWSGWPKSSVYDIFDDDWSGVVPSTGGTLRLAELSVRLKTPLHRLAVPVRIRER